MNLTSLATFFSTLPDRLRRRRWTVLGGYALLVTAAAFGLRLVSIDMTMEAFFPEQDPTRRMYDRFKESFGGDEWVYVVYEALDGDVFSEVSLNVVRRVQEELAEAAPAPGTQGGSPLSHIVEFKTILNADYLEVRGDSLRARQFIGAAIPRAEAARERLRRQALSHRSYPQLYLSRDSRYGGMLIRTDFGTIPEEIEAGESFEAQFARMGRNREADGEEPEKVRYRATSLEEYGEFSRALEALLARADSEGALAFYPVGNPVMMAVFETINGQLELLLLGALGMMLLVLFVQFRSVSAVLWPLSIVALSSLITLGLMGWLGVQVGMMVTVVALLILVVSVADTVHILSGYLFFRRNGTGHEAALRQVFQTSGVACLLTSLTTALGMLSLLLVPIPPIRNFGLAAAGGVMLAFVLTVTLLPLMLDLWAPRPGKPKKHSRARESLTQRFLAALEPFAYRYPLPVAGIFLAVGAFALVGLLRVEVDSNVVRILRGGVPLRVAHELVDREMAGTQGMEILLQFGRPDALKDPRVLNAMERLQTALETEESAFVAKTESLVNVVKESFQALNEDRAEMYRIPQQGPMLAQTLLLYEAADPGERARLASDDYSLGRIGARLYNYGSAKYVRFFEKVQQRLKETFDPLRDSYPELRTDVTGSLALLMRLADTISHSQVRSFGLALLVVTLLLFVMFGSIRVGLVAMIPNVLPVLATFGTMGWLGIPLDADTLILAPIIIGIAVDDTIHFITHYRAGFIASGRIEEAVRTSLREAGQAITFTTIILVLGFLVLVPSDHLGMSNLGFLTAVAFATALAADLLLLPSLCVLFKVRFAR